VILAAVSFSAASRVALGMAAWLAQQYGADLHVLYVEDPLLIAAADYLGFDLLRDTQAQLQQLIAEAWPWASGLPNSYVIGGPTVDVILDVARDARADLVVVGQCGLSGAERLLFDSMPDVLRTRADVPVLVASADAHAPCSQGT
jgi:nucleotide-binding universal stress UspA family protein